MVKYPHTAMISYRTAGTYNSVGDYTEGTLYTISFNCLIDPNNNARYIVGENGDKIIYHWDIYADLIDEDIPAGAKILLFGNEYPILQLFKYQTHTEMKI